MFEFYWGTTRNGFMTGRGIMRAPNGDGFIFQKRMQWKFYGIKFGKCFLGLSKRVVIIDEIYKQFWESGCS